MGWKIFNLNKLTSFYILIDIITLEYIREQ